MVKVVDALGTKYLHHYYAPLLSTLLREHLDKDGVDFTDARICFSCMAVIRNCFEEFPNAIIRDDDTEREELFKRYLSAKRQLIGFKSHEFPVPTSMEQIKENLRNPEFNNKYYTCNRNNRCQLLWAFIFMSVRPEVKFDTRGWLDAFFRMINEYYPSYKYAGKAIYYISDLGELLVEENPSREFCAKHLCCPYEVGNQNLRQMPEWDTPLKRITADFKKLAMPTSYRIKDYLPIGGKQP